jgi:hypothetical protein
MASIAKSKGWGVGGEKPVGWAEPTGPAFGRPDDKLRDTHRVQRLILMGFAKGSTHPVIAKSIIVGLLLWPKREQVSVLEFSVLITALSNLVAVRAKAREFALSPNLSEEKTWRLALLGTFVA